MAFDTSFSSIQNASTEMPFASGMSSQSESFWCAPISTEPRFTNTMPKGVGSSITRPRTPVTSPPVPLSDFEQPAKVAVNNISSIICFIRFLFFIPIAS